MHKCHSIKAMTDMEYEEQRDIKDRRARAGEVVFKTGLIANCMSSSGSSSFSPVLVSMKPNRSSIYRRLNVFWQGAILFHCTNSSRKERVDV